MTMDIEIKDLAGTVRTVTPLSEVEKKFYSAFFKNININSDQFDTNEAFAVKISDAIECLQAVDETVKSELGSFFVELCNFEMETEDRKLILVMISSGANGILKKHFSVEFFRPMPVAAKVIVQKK